MSILVKAKKILHLDFQKRSGSYENSICFGFGFMCMLSKYANKYQYARKRIAQTS